jgi:hypothetical protein
MLLCSAAEPPLQPLTLHSSAHALLSCRTPAHCIEYAHLILWSQQRSNEEFDTDNEEHMQWVYNNALTRAKQYGIEVRTVCCFVGSTMAGDQLVAARHVCSSCAAGHAQSGLSGFRQACMQCGMLQPPTDVAVCVNTNKVLAGCLLSAHVRLGRDPASCHCP